MNDRSKLMIVLASSLEDGGRRAAIALGVALAALANGSDVHLFLSLESARLATPTGCAGLQPRGFSDPLEYHVQQFLELGGALEVCSSCYEEYCKDLPKNAEGRPALRPSAVLAGLSLVARRSADMPILTF
jgi:predicted peroxiredoxin